MKAFNHRNEEVKILSSFVGKRTGKEFVRAVTTLGRKIVGPAHLFKKKGKKQADILSLDELKQAWQG